MDKIEQLYFDSELLDIGEDNPFVIFQAGYKSADLLPIEKVCPDCENVGILLDGDECSNCNGSGTIQIYYTPEQYEKIMGKPYPDDGLVRFFVRISKSWKILEYSQTKVFPYNFKAAIFYIVQTGQPAPPADYRPEE